MVQSSNIFRINFEIHKQKIENEIPQNSPQRMLPPRQITTPPNRDNMPRGHHSLRDRIYRWWDLSVPSTRIL